MSDYLLPDQLLIEVFLKLPIKTLLQLRSVCKSWLYIINCTNFISTHLKSSPNYTLFRRYGFYTENDSYSLCSNDPHDFSAQNIQCNLNLPLKSVNEVFRYLGSINGIVCFTDDMLSICHITILWNPSIRKWVSLPRPKFTFHTHGPFSHAMGFGFVNDDYKVVRVVYLDDDEGFSMPPEVEVYELSTRAWRVIDALSTPHYISYGCGGKSSFTYLNGVTHWFARRGRSEIGHPRLIVWFDFEKDTLGEMELPKSVAVAEDRHIFVATLGDSISIIHNDEHVCYVWVMEKYGQTDSWKVLYEFGLGWGLGYAFNFWCDGSEILISMKQHSGLFSFNPKTCQLRKLEAGFHYVDSYKESLVLVNQACEAATVPEDEAATVPEDEAATTVPEDEAATVPEDEAATVPEDEAATTVSEDEATTVSEDEAATTVSEDEGTK